MSRLTTLLDRGEEVICDSLGNDGSAKGTGIFAPVNAAMPCDGNCDICELAVPYAEMLEVIDE